MRFGLNKILYGLIIYLILSAFAYSKNNEDLKSNYDAMIIPGGGIQDNGKVHEWVKRRLDKAIELFTGKEFIILLGAYTVHKPPMLDKNKFPILEARAASNYLIKNKIPPKNILLETSSMDTIGNGYFGRVIHTDPRKLNKLLVINSSFHMPRTKAIFDWIYGLEPVSNKYKLEYLVVSDKKFDPKMMKIRDDKEKRSIQQLNKTKKGIDTLVKFHEWFFKEHKAYAAGLKPDKEKGKILKSY
jgi:uncharacterized SAM-binding protein YcdF (DUF218 family)